MSFRFFQPYFPHQDIFKYNQLIEICAIFLHKKQKSYFMRLLIFFLSKVSANKYSFPFYPSYVACNLLEYYENLCMKSRT